MHRVEGVIVKQFVFGGGASRKNESMYNIITALALDGYETI